MSHYRPSGGGRGGGGAGSSARSSARSSGGAGAATVVRYCTECSTATVVPGDHAAAAACPVCQAVAQHITDRELDGDDDDDEEDAHVADKAAELSSLAAAEEAVGLKRKAVHGDRTSSSDSSSTEDDEIVAVKKRSIAVAVAVAVAVGSGGSGSGRRSDSDSVLDGGGAGAASAPGSGADGLMEVEVKGSTVIRPWFRYTQKVTNWYQRRDGQLAPLNGANFNPCVVRNINNKYYVVREDFIHSNDILTLENNTAWMKNSIGVLTAVSWRGHNITGIFQSLLMTCSEPLCGADVGNIFNLHHQCKECGRLNERVGDQRELPG